MDVVRSININLSSTQNSDRGDGWHWEEARRFCVRVAHRYTSNPSEAEDIAQDALLRAWRRRSTLRDEAKRKEWLATIVRNEAFRQHARVRPEPVEDIEADEGAEDDRIIATIERADLHAALQQLDERDRQLLHLRYTEDLTQQVIASRLGLPDGTVKVRLHRLRHKLRRVMAEARRSEGVQAASAARRISSAAARGPI